MPQKKVFYNYRTSQSDDESKTPGVYPALVTNGPIIEYVGHYTLEDVEKAKKENGADIVDLGGKYLLPGFIDSHVHLLEFAIARDTNKLKLDLHGINTVDKLKICIREFAEQNTDLSHLLCKNWLPSDFEDKDILASTLAGLDTHKRPIIIEAADSHSSWCNQEAMEESSFPLKDIKEKWPHSLPDVTKYVKYDDKGNCCGRFSENAHLDYIHAYVATATYTGAELRKALGAAVHDYHKAGYTGIVGMYTKEYEWTALRQYMEEYKKKNGEYPLHMGVYWGIPDEKDHKKRQDAIIEASEMHYKYHPNEHPELCVLGIKIIADGTVDGRTAYISRPYPGDEELINPTWLSTDLKDAVAAADGLGLQCAIHAIGNTAVKETIDAFQAVHLPDSDSRHRIEHLEVFDYDEQTERMRDLGIIASIQPVASDPVGLRNYEELLGKDLYQRVFPYREIVDRGAAIAMGTDAPTAPHEALPTLYIATTRKSAMEPESDLVVPGRPLTLEQAVASFTEGAAYARFAEKWTGSIRVDLHADFVVVDKSFLAKDPVYQTWYKGVKVYDRDEELRKDEERKKGEEVKKKIDEKKEVEEAKKVDEKIDRPQMLVSSVAQAVPVGGR